MERVQLHPQTVTAIGVTRPKLLTEAEAAAYLSVEPQTLCVWRCTRRYNLPYIKVGSRVRYRPEDIEAFLAERTVGARREG